MARASLWYPRRLRHRVSAPWPGQNSMESMMLRFGQPLPARVQWRSVARVDSDGSSDRHDQVPTGTPGLRPRSPVAGTFMPCCFRAAYTPSSRLRPAGTGPRMAAVSHARGQWGGLPMTAGVFATGFCRSCARECRGGTCRRTKGWKNMYRRFCRCRSS